MSEIIELFELCSLNKPLKCETRSDLLVTRVMYISAYMRVYAIHVTLPCPYLANDSGIQYVN